MSLEAVLARIPYLAAHALAVEANGEEVRVRMAPKPDLTNHVGILHAGALFTAAETAAGIAAWRIVPGDIAFVLLRRAEVRYTRRAEGGVEAVARVSASDAEAARSAFAETGRADLAVEVEVADASGAAVLEASFEYALRPRSALSGQSAT